MTKKIYLTDQSGGGKPRREILVDDFDYTVSTSSGEAVVTLPGSRTYTSDDYLVLHANGLKIYTGVEYSRSSSTTVTATSGEMFPDGKFPYLCKLDFELYKTN